jgi:hypothetical protein
MMKVRAALPFLFATTFGAGASCVIIIEPSTPVPTPPGNLPLTCTTTTEAPTAHIFFSMRLERSTVNVKESYATMMETTAIGLTAAGILPTHAVLIRADERPVQNGGLLAAWGCNLDTPESLPLEDVIEHYATEPVPATPIGCVTDPLVEAGRTLTDLTTSYPQQLPGTSGQAVFGRAPTVALVIHFDERARRSALSDSACTKAHDLAAGDGDRAAWMHYSDGGPLADHVIHWFFATEEGVDRETFVTACRQYEGFPTQALDVIEPSPNAVYEPLADELEKTSGRVSTLPWCAAISEPDFLEFVLKEMNEIADLAGTEFDPDLFGMLLSGDLPSVEGNAGGGAIVVPGR